MQEESARIGNLLNVARVIDILTPEEQQRRPFTSLATVDLKTFNGESAPPGQVFTVALNPATGEFDKIVGTAPDRTAQRGSGEGGVKHSDVRQFTDNLRAEVLTRIFFEDVKEGYEREHGVEIANAGALLQALTSPLGGFDENKAKTYLSKEDQQAYSRLVSKGVDTYIGGELNPERIFNSLLSERLSTPPGTLGKNKVSVPGLRLE